ncbi:GTP-binding protein Di-Ras2 [Caerostris darwini]|uniref:GTP-binding protein Di-Ras2 n=1 Tax=Caerostris darwini TaxID=1538125 RepID=A0AAV4RAS9_9ARAC|nr:GTP-binding protein Di-Ras2 [Caerostris darwini]
MLLIHIYWQDATWDSKLSPTAQVDWETSRVSSKIKPELTISEIREQKSDFQEVPIVVVGNKSDVGEERRAVPKEDAAEWLFCELPRLRAKILECSAKDNANIKEIFRAFLQLSKLPLPAEGLRRRSSAHATGSTANGASNRLQCPPEGGEEAAQHSSSSSSLPAQLQAPQPQPHSQDQQEGAEDEGRRRRLPGHHGQHRRLLHIVNFSLLLPDQISVASRAQVFGGG